MKSRCCITCFFSYYVFYIIPRGGCGSDGGGASAFIISSDSLGLRSTERHSQRTRAIRTSFLSAYLANNDPEEEFPNNSSSDSSLGSSSAGQLESFSQQNEGRADDGRLPVTPPDEIAPTGASEETTPTSQQQPLLKNIWETSAPVGVQGSSLKTWSFATSAIQRIQVVMKTDGRPMNAEVDLWQGPGNTPQKMAVYIEDGSLRPFTVVVETPGYDNSIAIRNVGQLEYPLSACLEAEMMMDDYYNSNDNNNKHECYHQEVVLDIRRDRRQRRTQMSAAPTFLAEMYQAKTIQGGSVHTFPFASSIASAQILLTTDGRPLNARIELLQGPNNVKQIIELYAQDGLARPFYSVIECPGSGNVLRLINTGAVEFPISAIIEPYTREDRTTFESKGAANDDFFTVT